MDISLQIKADKKSRSISNISWPGIAKLRGPPSRVCSEAVKGLTGMIPILHSPGLMMPGQLGPISLVLFCPFMTFLTLTCEDGLSRCCHRSLPLHFEWRKEGLLTDFFCLHKEGDMDGFLGSSHFNNVQENCYASPLDSLECAQHCEQVL